MNLTSIFALVQALAWPTVALIAAILFRDQMGSLLKAVSQRATKLSVMQVSVELAVVPELQVSPSLDQIRELTTPIGTQSSESSLFRDLTSSGGAEFVIVNLGSASQPRWLTSRLYIGALLFERMRGIRSIVFVESTDERRHSYIGCALPSTVRWALGIRYPWLEQAYAAAYSAVSTQPNFQILSQWGTLPPEIASEIVQQFLISPLVRTFPAPGQAMDNEWISIPSLGGYEHAKWVDAPRLEHLLGISLYRASISDSPDIPPAEISRRVLRRPVPFVARVSNANRFETLIDRGYLLERIALREGEVF
jgi:hypothetical protein